MKFHTDKPENMKLWVEALRSGEYKQGKGQLAIRKEDTFCCLGVACEIAAKNGAELEIRNDGDFRYYDDHETDLPPSVFAWLGLGPDEDTLDVRTKASEYTDVITLNDQLEWSFEDIADAIEESYVGVAS